MDKNVQQMIYWVFANQKEWQCQSNQNQELIEGLDQDMNYVKENENTFHIVAGLI